MSTKAKRESALPAIIACLLVMFFTGILYMWSVYQNPVSELFGWSRDAVKLTSSFSMMAFVIGCLTGGLLQDRNKPRLVAYIGCALFSLGIFIASFATGSTVWHIYIFYGCLGGLGTGFCYTVALSVLQKWLAHRVGFASGLAIASFGLSVVLFSPITDALIVKYGPMIPMRALAAIFFIVLMIACAFIRNPSQEYTLSLNVAKKANIDRRQYTTKETAKDPRIWMLFFAMLTGTATYNILMPIFKPLAEMRGLTSFAVMAVMFVGIGSTVARFIAPILSDKIGQSPVLVILGIVNCIFTVLMIWANGAIYIVTVLIIAFAFGGSSSCFAALCTNIFGNKYSAANYGIVLISLGLSSLIFNQVSTWLNNYAMSRSAGGELDYTLTFIVAAIIGLGQVILMAMIPWVSKRRAARGL